ncbi:hypermethylated in cancer 2 protein-like [Acipenser oxyrinchus oxyrinchus]|uniref:Hypermethylated in cancer 2 protein-like n=1 Tax=Acipenser oxyrinchus oxyrinchus TaxID=40147 RepID=A0AAD8CP38_ACIOX|nr:hypermethylated in cancer 2 protein-like [Acipenser oxyrinchus oxyrinchus]
MDPDNSSCSSGVTGPSPSHRLVDLQFPNYSAVLLEHLNQHREEGKFCDLAVHVRGQVFRAHKAVLAASSSYFHDKLMLRDSDVIALPSVIEPRAFAGLLGLIYTGRLRVTVQDMPSYLLVASGLQLWHVVDRCKEILKREEEQKHFHKKRSYRNCRSTSQSPSSSQVLVGCREDTGGRDYAARVHTQEGLAVRREREGDRQGGPEGQEGEDGPCLRPSSNSKTEGELYYSTEREDHYYYSNSNNTTGNDEEYEVDEDMEGQRLRTMMSSSKEPGPVSLLGAGPVVVDSASFPDGTRVIADPTGYPANAVTQQPMDIHGNEIVTHASLGQAVHAPVKILSVAPDGKRFGCLCGKRFAVKPKRDRHIMLTLSVRPFDCSVCEKKFKLKHHLNEHMKTHMGFLYKCERCGRKFRMRSCYLKHLQQEEEQLQQQSASASSVL